MSFKIDGFNERMNYIKNSNNVRNKPNRFDNSFGKMRSEERKGLVETANNDQVFVAEEAKGNKDNFIIRNNAINNANHKPSSNNPVRNALNRNMFKK